MWFKRKIKPQEGELDKIYDVLTIIEQNPKRRIKIKGFTQYFENFIKQSGIEYTIERNMIRPCIVLFPDNIGLIEIEYNDTMDTIQKIAVPTNNIKTIDVPTGNETSFTNNEDEVEAVLSGKYVPPVVKDGILTADEYCSAKIAAMEQLEGKRGQFLYEQSFADNIMIFQQVCYNAGEPIEW